jgi:hypothetical protein
MAEGSGIPGSARLCRGGAELWCQDYSAHGVCWSPSTVTVPPWREDPLGSGVPEGHPHDDDGLGVAALNGVDGDVSLLGAAGRALGRGGTDVET